MRPRRMIFIFAITLAWCYTNVHAYGQNLALRAKAAASESLSEEMSPEKAIDDNLDTRWSAKAAHFDGVWYQLEWDKPVQVGQVAIVQYDQFTTAMDLQTWDDANGSWKTIQHFGGSSKKLSRVVVATFEPRKISKLRIANFAGGPSFTEIEVYEKPEPPIVVLASDANGGIIGIVTDKYGSAPIGGAEVEFTGQAKTGPWHATVKSNEKGLFFAPMPLGLSGRVEATVRLDGNSSVFVHDASQFSIWADAFRPGYRIDALGWQPVEIYPRPAPGFWKPEFDGSCSNIKVPAHWEMEGFHSPDNVGGYIRKFEAPGGEGRLKLRFDGVYSGAEVWVNGQRLAEHEGGATPFEIDVTDAVHPGENLLALRVTQHNVTSDDLDKMSEYADFDLAGIIRSVYLFRVPEKHIASVAIATVFDEKFKDATIAGKMAVVNESAAPLDKSCAQIHACSTCEGKAWPVAKRRCRPKWRLGREPRRKSVFRLNRPRNGMPSIQTSICSAPN